MKRDGNNLSLWQDTTTHDPVKSSKPIRRYNVIIIGAGITGLTTALMLQSAGKQCLIIEATAVGFGTTSGTSAHLNTVLDTPYTDIIKDFGMDAAILTATAAKEALQIIENFVSQYNIDCDFELCDGYMYATDAKEGEELDKLLNGIREVGLPGQYISDIPAPMKFTKAIKFGQQGRFHPLKYLTALLSAYQQLGGHLLEDCIVTKVIDGDNLQQVWTANSPVYEADEVVYATHTPPGIHLLTFKLAPYRSYVMGFQLDPPQHYPEDLIYDMKEPFHYLRKAKYKNEDILIVGGQDHKTGHHDNTDFNFAELEAFVKAQYPVRKRLYKWSSQYYESTDGLPYIGYFPGKRNKRQFVATGYSGNGMIFGTLSAHIISGLILKGNSVYQDLFSPSRVKPVAGFQSFVSENVDVVKHFMVDRLSITKIESAIELARGQGEVVNLEGQRVGLYKDIDGKLYGVDPVCKHAGCVVNWNNTERSWDCPCHGARYAPDGTLLTGPATEGLHPIDFDD